MDKNNWSIQAPWNEGLITQRQDRRIEKRDFLYASEIGKNFLDVYWSMQGVAPTNLASDVARRKMEAGNFYEALVVWSLRKIGLIVDTQTRSRITDHEKWPNVYGRIDIIAGHDGNWDKTREEVKAYFDKMEQEGFDFPLFSTVKKISMQTIEMLAGSFPEGLDKKIYEVKSINSMAFWRNDAPISTPYDHHKIQLSFYQMTNDLGIKDGSFLYIDRDTMSISEIPNFVTEEITKKIADWLDQMTHYVKNSIEPPKPEFIVWDAKYKKYSFNWEINRSQYKDKILEGVSEIDIIREVNTRNKKMRTNNKMTLALEGSAERGTGKYKQAIELIKTGAPDEVVIKKTKVLAEEIVFLKNGLLPS